MSYIESYTKERRNEPLYHANERQRECNDTSGLGVPHVERYTKEHCDEPLYHKEPPACIRTGIEAQQLNFPDQSSHGLERDFP